MSSRTLLDGVNDLLKRAKIVQGESRKFNSLTDKARQTAIDVAVMAWNEVQDELYAVSNDAFQFEPKEAVITLVDGQREYDLPSDLVEIRWPLINEDQGRRIDKYVGGFIQMRQDQLQPDNYNGMPSRAVINEINFKLRMDYTPTAEEDATEFKLLYDRDMELRLETDVFPFTDAVYRALLPAAHQLWRRNMQNNFDQALFRGSIARAAALLNPEQKVDTWAPRRASTQARCLDPFEDC